MANINMTEDVIADILLRLPPKTLVRFRSVSGSWRSSIKTTHFIKLHLNHSTHTHSHRNLILLQDSNFFALELDSLTKASRFDSPLKIPQNNATLTLTGSCNGLLCIGKSEKRCCLVEPIDQMVPCFTFNPNTEVNPDFPVWECRFLLGFGYDPFHDDYKVLRMVLMYGQVVNTFACDVKLYGLKSDSWKSISHVHDYVSMLSDPHRSYDYNTGSGLCVGGALNWVMNVLNICCKHTSVVAFDFGDERFHPVDQPDYWREGYYYNINAAVLDGKFCIMCNHSKVHVDVWVMKEYRVRESWVKLFSVAQEHRGYITPLSYSKSNDKVLLEKNGEKLMWYDLTWGSFTNVKIKDAPRCFDALMRQESLVSPNVGDRRDRRKQEY